MGASPPPLLGSVSHPNYYNISQTCCQVLVNCPETITPHLVFGPVSHPAQHTQQSSRSLGPNFGAGPGEAVRKGSKVPSRQLKHGINFDWWLKISNPTKGGKLLLEILRNRRLQALVSKNPPRRLPSVLSPVSWNTNNNDGLKYDSVFHLFFMLC